MFEYINELQNNQGRHTKEKMRMWRTGVIVKLKEKLSKHQIRFPVFCKDSFVFNPHFCNLSTTLKRALRCNKKYGMSILEKVLAYCQYASRLSDPNDEDR